jgi:hypothetical protein
MFTSRTNTDPRGRTNSTCGRFLIVRGGITEAIERRVERKRFDDMNCGVALAPANALRG